MFERELRLAIFEKSILFRQVDRESYQITIKELALIKGEIKTIE